VSPLPYDRTVAPVSVPPTIGRAAWKPARTQPHQLLYASMITFSACVIGGLSEGIVGLDDVVQAEPVRDELCPLPGARNARS